MKNARELTKKLFQENEKKSCYLLTSIVLFFAFIEILVMVLSTFSLIKIDLNYDRYVLTISSIVNIFVGLSIWIIPNYRVMKYVLLTFLVLNVGTLDSSFSYVALGLVIVPTIISSRFYNKRLTLYVIILTIITLFFSTLASYYAAKQLTEQELSSNIIRLDWSNFKEVIVSNYLIKILLLTVPFSACYVNASNGRDLIHTQANISLQVGNLESEIKTASIIQQQVLPKDYEIVRGDGISLYALMKPAKDVAGDFYDFFRVDDNFYFLVGDVSDKGLYAAMFMMNVKNTIQSIAVNTKNIEDIINKANKLISKGNQALMFVTLWIGCMNLKTKETYFVNAGHNPAFIKKKNNEIIKIENKPQPFIGTFPDYKFKQSKLDFEEGDSIILYTDGVIDASNRNGQSFGEGRFKETIEKSFSTPKELCDNLLTDINKFSSHTELYDDITAFCLSYEKLMYDKYFDIDSKNISIILNDLNTDLKKNNVKDDTINLIDTAMDDLLDNVISYAYKEKLNNKFRFGYQIKNNYLTVIVEDCGVLFNPLKIREADLSKDRAIGGLGIHLIKNIMDTFEYSRNDNKNISILTKKIS